MIAHETTIHATFDEFAICHCTVLSKDEIHSVESAIKRGVLSETIGKPTVCLVFNPTEQ